MKARSMIWVILVCVAGTLFAETSPTNTVPINIPEKYEIKSYSPKKGLVGVKSSVGQTNLPFSAFNPAQQQDIVAWLIDKEFQGSGLDVSIEKTKNTEKVEQQQAELITGFTGATTLGVTKIKRGTIDEVNYMISLENRSAVEFQTITVEYCLFYQSTANDQEQKLCIKGSDHFDLLPGKNRRLQTHVSLHDTKTMDKIVTSGTYSQSGAPPVFQKDRLLGLYVCVSKKDRNGKLIQVESEDGNIPDKETWAEYTEPPPPPKTQQMILR